jgi:hypothetical protein
MFGEQTAIDGDSECVNIELLPQLLFIIVVLWRCKGEAAAEDMLLSLAL